MAESRLDQIVKGAPPPTAKLPEIASQQPAPLPNLSSASTLTEKTPSSNINADPVSALPSSPPQIYLNLLILESSLRSQYLDLRGRRRLHTFFALLLILWNAVWTYLLFLRPREDGVGHGGSVYWFVEVIEKVCFMGGVLTGLLIWGTGQWDRGMKWPRRWLYVANRGLRGMNTKIVIVQGPWWKEWIGSLSFLFPYSSFFPSPGSEWHYVEHEKSGHGRRQQQDEESTPGSGYVIEEDLAPGGDHIKLLLLPKSFSPEFRENWDEYRSEYWERENERRAALRRKIRQRRKALARQQGGWLWLTGMWRMRASGSMHHDRASVAHQRDRTHASEKDKETRALQRRSLLRSESSHSRTSSRSSTPQDVEQDPLERPGSQRTRRGSSSASVRRKGKESRAKVSPLTKAEMSAAGMHTSARGSDSRPSTPESGNYSTVAHEAAM